MQCASLRREGHPHPAPVLRTHGPLDQAVLLQAADEPGQRALAEVDPVGDLLHPVGAAAVRRRALGQQVENLEVTRAQSVPVQRPVHFALGAGMQGQDVPPLLHERLFGLLLRRHERTVAEERIYCTVIKCTCIACTCM